MNLSSCCSYLMRLKHLESYDHRLACYSSLLRRVSSDDVPLINYWILYFASEVDNHLHRMCFCLSYDFQFSLGSLRQNVNLMGSDYFNQAYYIDGRYMHHWFLLDHQDFQLQKLDHWAVDVTLPQCCSLDFHGNFLCTHMQYCLSKHYEDFKYVNCEGPRRRQYF